MTKPTNKAKVVMAWGLVFKHPPEKVGEYYSITLARPKYYAKGLFKIIRVQIKEVSNDK